MGGRGATSSGIKPVAYDKWGKMIDQDIFDKDGNNIGYIRDEQVWTYEPDVRKITKKEALSEAEAWRMDDGTYGDDDTAIYIAYKDGTFVDARELDGKPFKKTGVVGVSISAPDYEMVWGGEVSKKTGKIEPWTTHEFDSNGDPTAGHTNSYSSVKATGVYKVRRKVTFNNPNGKGGYKTVRETIRKSTVKPYGG